MKTRNEAPPAPCPCGPMEAWAELVRVADTLNNSAAAALRPHDLTPAQFELLDLLEGMRCGCCGEGECRCDASYICQNDIGARIATTKANVSGIVQRLVKDGLISREPNPNNRRENAVRITAKGRSALFAARPDTEEAIARAFCDFGDRESAALLALLRRLPGRDRGKVENGG